MNRKCATAEISSLLEEFDQVVQLSKKEIAEYGSHFTTGWSVIGLSPGREIALRILLPKDFPFEAPRIGVWPNPGLLAWPHLEDHGLLCLSSGQCAISHERPKAVLISLLLDACTLIEESLSRNNLEAFRDEFTTYWRLWAKSPVRLVALFDPISHSRKAVGCKVGNSLIVGINQDQLENWIMRVTPKLQKMHPIFEIPYIWFDKFPTPDNYPVSLDKIRLLLAYNQEALGLFESYITAKSLGSKYILFGSGCTTGLGFGALEILCTKKIDKRIGETQHLDRRRRIPNTARILTEIRGAEVTRCGYNWIHGRDHGSHGTILKGKSVIILGIGSIGSGLAELLAKAGVGTICLVDPENLAPENVARHSLGIGDLWRNGDKSSNKAESLSRNLNQRFPHINTFAYSKKWRDLSDEGIFNFNLVISVIGNWNVESLLNDCWLAYPEPPPIVYGWTEPHGVAGHGILLRHGDGCLRCLVDEMGQYKERVATIPDHQGLIAVPACGGEFQPYGAIEVGFVQGMIAELCTSFLSGNDMESKISTWIGFKTTLDGIGGSWKQEWIEQNFHPGDGGRIHKHALVKDLNCHKCGNNK